MEEESEIEDMIGKAIHVFDSNGVGQYSIDYPWSDGQLEMLEQTNANYAILEKRLPDQYWMDVSSETKEIWLREELEADITCDKLKTFCDGVDEITISNIPNPSILLINSNPIEVTNTTFAISASEVTSCHITMGGKHKSNHLFVEFVNANDIKAAKWTELKQIRETKLSTAVTSFGTFDSDPVAKSNITGTVTGILARQGVGVTPPDISFRMTDNLTVNFSPSDFIQASLEVSLYLEGVYKHSWNLKEYLETLTNIEDIENLTWETDID